MKWFFLSFVFAILTLSILTESANAQTSLRSYGAGFDSSPRAILNPINGKVMAIVPGQRFLTPSMFGVGYGVGPRQFMGGGGRYRMRIHRRSVGIGP